MTETVCASLINMLCVCFAEEDSQPDTTSINVVLLGALAKDFNQAVNQGVGTPLTVLERLTSCSLHLHQIFQS